MLDNIIEENKIADVNFTFSKTEKGLINKNIISKAEEKYLEEFPKRNSDKLRYEVGKIAELFVNNQESNRYAQLLSKKASKNKIIKQVQNFKESEINILNYNNKKMKAQITYKDLAKEYNLVLDMNVVSEGRLFVRNFEVNKKISKKTSFINN